jgi:NAD(P)-dependent dehydrogenase (short-subunit alcohol dehydrogenase family)
VTRSSQNVPAEHLGRVAAICGGAASVGGAIAGRLQQLGALVTLLDAEPPSDEGVPTDGGTDRGSIAFSSVDVSEERHVVRAFDEIVQTHGRLDYLVYCARDFPVRPFLELTTEEWRGTHAGYLTGAFLSCREALRAMKARRFGRIVLFSSLFARTGLPGGAAFTASAGGVLGLARSLALEVAADDIRVNTLSVADPSPLLHVGSRARGIPLAREARADDIVEAVVFLLGDDGSYLVGQDLRLTGGVGLW